MHKGDTVSAGPGLSTRVPVYRSSLQQEGLVYDEALLFLFYSIKIKSRILPKARNEFTGVIPSTKAVIVISLIEQLLQAIQYSSKQIPQTQF
jgi:hypothetical protein